MRHCVDIGRVVLFRSMFSGYHLCRFPNAVGDVFAGVASGESNREIYKDYKQQSSGF